MIAEWLRRSLHGLNLIAFSVVIGFFLELWPLSFVLMVLLPVAGIINLTFALVALMHLTAGRKEGVRPLNLITILIGVCYVSTFVLNEMLRVK